MKQGDFKLTYKSVKARGRLLSELPGNMAALLQHSRVSEKSKALFERDKDVSLPFALPIKPATPAICAFYVWTYHFSIIRDI